MLSEREIGLHFGRLFENVAKGLISRCARKKTGKRGDRAALAAQLSASASLRGGQNRRVPNGLVWLRGLQITVVSDQP